MISFDWNSETFILIISGSGTLARQANYTNAIHITVEGFNVLGDGCFIDYHNLASISLPDTLYTIGNDMLLNTKLTNFHFPKNVRYLSGAQPFDKQSSLGNITVDPENKYFRDVDGVLYSKNMKELHFYPGNRPETTCTVPNGVEIIKKCAFANSRIRKEIIIPPSVKSIEWGLGYNSLVIEKVTILQCPELVKIDKESLFAGTSRGEEIIYFDYTKCIFPKTCKNPNNRVTSFNILLLKIIMIS